MLLFMKRCLCLVAESLIPCDFLNYPPFPHTGVPPSMPPAAFLRGEAAETSFVSGNWDQSLETWFRWSECCCGNPGRAGAWVFLHEWLCPSLPREPCSPLMSSAKRGPYHVKAFPVKLWFGFQTSPPVLKTQTRVCAASRGPPP